MANKSLRTKAEEWLRAVAKEDLLYAHHGAVCARPEAYDSLVKFVSNATAKEREKTAEQQRLLKEEKGGCPCSLVEPCCRQCTCANSAMSGGCRRCCRYGSDDQRKHAATRLAAQLDKAAEVDNAVCWGVNCVHEAAALDREYNAYHSFDTRRQEFENRIAALEKALADCGTHDVCTDSCAVCGLHFADCEKEIRILATGPGELEGPREFACPGARARALLKPKEGVHVGTL